MHAVLSRQMEGEEEEEGKFIVPGVPCVDHGNWGRERNMSLALGCFAKKVLVRIAAFYVYLTYEDVDVHVEKGRPSHYIT